MKFDKPLIAVLLGAISTIPAEILTRGLVFLGIGKYSVYELDSLLITFNRPTIFMGIVVNFIIGGFAAMIFYYALKKIGIDYLIIKSACIGFVAWTLTELLFTSTVEGKYIPIRPISDYYVHILGAVAYGVTLGILIKKYLVNRDALICVDK